MIWAVGLPELSHRGETTFTFMSGCHQIFVVYLCMERVNLCNKENEEKTIHFCFSKTFRNSFCWFLQLHFLLPASVIALQRCLIVGLYTLVWEPAMETTKELKMLQHDGKKSHSCNQCGYSAISASKLKIHMLVHSGEKPFSCKQCEYSCTRAGTLKSHIFTHSAFQVWSV